MPAKQPGTNDAFSVDFTRPFDQAQEQAKSVFATQKELLDALERMNEYWFARAKSEAELVTSVANKLASARSVPDLNSVCQDWLGQRMQRYVEDSNHVFDDVQKLSRAGPAQRKTAAAAARRAISEPTDLYCAPRAKSATGAATARALSARKCRSDPSDRVTDAPVQSEEMQAAPAEAARASYSPRRRDGPAPNGASRPRLG
jgi:hypothetical protein